MQPLWLYRHGYITVGLSVLVYGGVGGSSVKNTAMRSHMFLQNGQDGYKCCWTWYRLITV